MIHPVDLNDGAVDVAKESDEWATPWAFFKALDEKYHFAFDLCASPTNAKCSNYWTKEDDALKLIPELAPNGEWLWCNPPYSKPNLPAFTKALRDMAHIARTVMLVPATPGAGWFQDNVLGGADLVNYLSIDRGPLEGKVLQFSGRLCRIEVNFLRGRLNFEMREGTSAKTDSALVRYFPRGVNW